MDPWLEDFARRTVAFSVWHYPDRVEAIALTVARIGEEKFRCDLLVQDAGCALSLAADAPEVFEAIQLAAERLELVLLDYDPRRSSGPLEPRVAA